jgi:hypothetical protein
MFGSNSSSPTAVKTDQPLDLTVHSLPSTGEAAPQAQTRWGRIKMLIVLGVCAAPVVASYFTYYVIKPKATRNYGELMTELKPLPNVSGLDVNGQAVSLPSLRKQWLLVSVGGGACDDACEKHLYMQRQLREALGKEKDRLDWVWLVNDTVPVKPELLPALKAATVLRVPKTDVAAWLTPATGQSLSAHLYLVDPHGQWMMRFPAQAEPYKIKADMERLLRASASWDKPGR